MSAIAIDFDRGVAIRNIHRTGMDVYMYIDTPGVYFARNGHEVPEAIAREAGFDIEKLGKERVKRQRLRDAYDAIERDSDAGVSTHSVVDEKGGFRLVDIGQERYIITSADDSNVTLTAVPLPHKEAKRLWDELTKEVAAPKKTEEKGGNKASGEKGKVSENGGSAS